MAVILLNPRYSVANGHAFMLAQVQDRPFVVLQALESKCGIVAGSTAAAASSYRAVHGSMLTKKLPGPKVGTPIWERSRACKLWPPARAVETGLQVQIRLRICTAV
eukprot:2661024-Pleurochrysis_carterae.AAC.9